MPPGELPQSIKPQFLRACVIVETCKIIEVKLFISENPQVEVVLLVVRYVEAAPHPT